LKMVRKRSDEMIGGKSDWERVVYNL